MAYYKVNTRHTVPPLSALAVTAVALVVALLCLAVPATADDGGIAVQVMPAKRECFYENVPGPGVKVFLHYMVTTGGSLDIDAEVRDPGNKLVWKSEKDSENRVLFKSMVGGKYAFCFSNEMSTVTPKVVAFSVLVGDGSNRASTQGVAGPDTPRDSLRLSTARILRGLQEIEEIQSFMRVRERQHRATTEVANTRVVIWSLVEILAIVGMGVANVYYLKKMFKTKRMV